MVSELIGVDTALIEAARCLASSIRAAFGEIERERRLPLSLVRAMQQAGIFSMVMPRAWGGPEADPLTQIRVIEELSAADGSVGWCAMIGSDGGYFTNFLDQQVGRALYPDLSLVTAAMTQPLGRASVVPGGYRVSGRWPFVSGCQHSTWLAANCFVYEEGVPRADDSGAPETRMVYLPMADCQILDTWTTTGLRGSGSHDVLASDLFVPYERSFNVETSPLQRAGPLYAYRRMFIANGAGVPFGIARAAIDALVELAATKVSRPGSGLRDEAHAQIAVARAESLLGAARSYVYDVMSDVWATLVAGNELSVGQRARFRLSFASSCHLCVEAVNLVYAAGGGSSLYATNPLDRYLRDIHTVNQHIVNSPRTYQTAGRMLFGLDPDQPGW